MTQAIPLNTRLLVSAHSPERLRDALSAILNVATVAAQYGYIPTEDDRLRPEITGRSWYKEPDTDRYQLASVSNNSWAHVREVGGNSLTVEFSFRYDSRNVRKNALTALMAAFFEGASLLTIPS